MADTTPSNWADLLGLLQPSYQANKSAMEQSGRDSINTPYGMLNGSQIQPGSWNGSQDVNDINSIIMGGTGSNGVLPGWNRTFIPDGKGGYTTHDTQQSGGWASDPSKLAMLMAAGITAGAASGALGGAGAAADAGAGAGAIGSGASSIPLDISSEIVGGAATPGLTASEIGAAGGGGLSSLGSSIPVDISSEIGTTNVGQGALSNLGGDIPGYSPSLGADQGMNEWNKLISQNDAPPGSLYQGNVPTYDTTGKSLVDKLIDNGTNKLLNKGISSLLGGTAAGGAQSGASSGGSGGPNFSALPNMILGKGQGWTPQMAYDPSLPNTPQFQQVQGYANGGLVDDLASWFGGDSSPVSDVGSSVSPDQNSNEWLKLIGQNDPSVTIDQGPNEWNKLVDQNTSAPSSYGSNGGSLGDTITGGLSSVWNTLKGLDPKTIQMILGGVGLASSLLGKHGQNAQGIPTSLSGQLSMLGGLNRSPSAASMNDMASYFNSPAYTKTQQFIGTPAQYAKIPYTNQGSYQWFTHADGGMADEGKTVRAPMGCLHMMEHGGHVNGPGDGQSDHVPALLSRDEFVVPADVVSALGAGSSSAGGHSLQQLIDAVRHDARSGPTDRIPPAPKSPLEYLKGKR